MIPIFFPLPFISLEVGPINLARVLKSAVNSPRGVWSRSPAEIEFGAFLPECHYVVNVNAWTPELSGPTAE